MQESADKYSYLNEIKKERRYRVVNILLMCLIVALLVALIVFSTTLTTMLVKGDSMQPNLLDGNRILLVKHHFTLDYGDIVVIDRGGSADDRYIVKRVVGKSGDVVKFDVEKKLWVRNGKPITDDYFDGEYSDSYLVSSSIENELKGEGFKVPDNGIFVLGDNRNISNDSRQNGAFAMKKVVGKVIHVFN